MSALPKFIAALLLFNCYCKANTERHTERDISYTKMMRTNGFENNNDILAKCVSDVFEIASYTLRGDVALIYDSIDGNKQFILGDLVERVLHRDVMIIKYFAISKIAQVHTILVLTFVDSYESLLKINNNYIHSAAVAQDHKHYIIIVLMVPDYSTAAPINEMQKIFQQHYKFSLIDVNIIVATSKEVYIYTYYPFTYGHCGSTRPVLLDRCSEKTGYSFRRKNIFLHKNVNMNLCPFKVSAAHLPPFIMLKKPFMGEENLTGIDGEILKVISKKLNFSIAFSDNSNDIGGTVYDNGTSTGVYNLLNQRQVDLTLGYSECTPNRLRFLASTKSYYQTSLRILLKDSERYSSLETVFFPFSTKTWIIVLIVNILRITCLILKRYQYHNRLNKAVPNMLFIAWCFLTLMFCASYSSLFFTFMLNQPSRPLPRSIQELREQNYKILTDIISGNIAQNIDELKDLLIIVNSTPYHVLKEFEESSLHKLGVLTNLETCSYYVKKESINFSKYVSLDESLMDSMFCMYFPYLSYFANKFNKRITQLNTFGLTTQIARKFISPIHLPNTKEYRSHLGNDASSSEILSLHHLKGPFIIFFGCHAIAGIVFVLEILSLKFRVLSRGFLIFTK